MRRYTFFLLITLVVILMIGCASKYSVLCDQIYSSAPDNEENSTIFKVQKSLKVTYNLLAKSLKFLEYEIEKKNKYCQIEALKGTVILHSVSILGSSAKAVSYDQFNYNAKVWLKAISDQETQVCIQVIVNKAFIKDSRVQKDSEKIYRSESSEKEIISGIQKHF